MAFKWAIQWRVMGLRCSNHGKSRLGGRSRSKWLLFASRATTRCCVVPRFPKRDMTKKSANLSVLPIQNLENIGNPSVGDENNVLRCVFFIKFMPDILPIAITFRYLVIAQNMLKLIFISDAEVRGFCDHVMILNSVEIWEQGPLSRWWFLWPRTSFISTATPIPRSSSNQLLSRL